MEVVFSCRIPDLTYNVGPYIFEPETPSITTRKKKNDFTWDIIIKIVSVTLKQCGWNRLGSTSGQKDVNVY
jgi:hypothetical protein